MCASYDIVVKLLGTSQQFVLLPRADVDERELEQWWKDEDHARGVPYVDRLEIGDAHRVTARRGQLGGHRQHGGHAERDARRLRVLVDPEANPRQHHDQYRRNVRLENEETDLAL